MSISTHNRFMLLIVSYFKSNFFMQNHHIFSTSEQVVDFADKIIWKCFKTTWFFAILQQSVIYNAISNIRTEVPYKQQSKFS
jgi:hypothetical protein